MIQPPGACKLFDSHLHIIDYRFPLVPNHGYLPEEFLCADYLARTRHLNVIGGAIVSGSFQAFDQTYLLAALRELGPAFVGVTQIPVMTPDNEILRLDRAGVRGVRFNLKRGGSEGLAHLEKLARRVYEVAGWHCELYVDARDLADLVALLTSLPALAIDHLGLSREGFPTLLKLVERGVRVKATGFGRVDFDVRQAIRAIVSVNPEALMFGTDLPSTRAPRPFLDHDIDHICESLDADLVQRVLYQNALSFYRLALHPPPC